MEFKIGDRVKRTLNYGVTVHGAIIDKIYSEARKEWSYEVLLENDECSYPCKESDLELDTENITYEVKVDSYDGVVSAIVYECVGDLRLEITRGHGHNFHGGRYGTVQALSYALKKAWEKINDGSIDPRNEG